jgi:HEAT repeat protein
MVVATVALLAASSHAQEDTSRMNALVRDLQDQDFDKAYAAAEQLRKYPQYRPQVVAGLIETIRTRDWDRCAGDMRDTIARALGELNAKEGVIPLLELVKSGKSIEHECAE